MNEFTIIGVDIANGKDKTAYFIVGNRDIIDAIQSAATALAEAGYDAVEVFKALPEILEELDTEETKYSDNRISDLLRRIKGE